MVTQALNLLICFQYLAVGHVPRRLPTTFTELQYISIRINLNHLEECRTALCLLRSAPNLYDLEMLVSFFPRPLYVGCVWFLTFKLLYDFLITEDFQVENTICLTVTKKVAFK